MTSVFVTKVTKAGQVSIPKPIRESFCEIGDSLAWERVGETLLVRKVVSGWEPLLEEIKAEAEARGLTPEKVEATVKIVREKVFTERYGKETSGK